MWNNFIFQPKILMFHLFYNRILKNDPKMPGTSRLAGPNKAKDFLMFSLGFEFRRSDGTNVNTRTSLFFGGTAASMFLSFWDRFFILSFFV